ncbi:hypothetical protein ACVWYH_002148 [Bradyrhizobium sp. GM24.11]
MGSFRHWRYQLTSSRVLWLDLGRARARLHQFEHRSSLVRDAPPSIHTLDESLRKEVELGHAGAHALGARRPIGTARGQNGHVSLEVRHGCEPVGIAHKDLQHRDLEIHMSTMSVVRTYRHIVGAERRASMPTCLRRSAVISPLLAASKILEATWARVPVSLRGRPSQTSSRTVRKSAVVVASNTWRLRKAQRMVARGSTLKLSNELLADSKTMNFTTVAVAR